MPTNKFPTALICDLGDVLFTWTSSNFAEIPRTDLFRILTSPIWQNYERGKFTEEEAYGALSEEYGFGVVEIRNTLSAARDTLKSSEPMLHLLKKLRATGLRIYAMSNISLPDWKVLRTKASEEDWGLFERIFIS
jgi:FMN phosphatase YigB (HAD superfamily)